MTNKAVKSEDALPDEALALGQQLCFAVYSATHAFNRAYKPLLDRFGLTYPQYLVLLALWQRDGMLDYVGLPELVSAKTDAKGEAEVALRNAGLNVLAVSHDVPLEGSSAADETGYTATLTFVGEPHVDE